MIGAHSFNLKRCRNVSASWMRCPGSYKSVLLLHMGNLKNGVQGLSRPSYVVVYGKPSAKIQNNYNPKLYTMYIFGARLVAMVSGFR